MDPKKEYVIVWAFDKKLLTHAKLLMAPDITAETLEHKITSYPAILEFSKKTSHVQISDYAGIVKLSPCKMCTKNLLGYEK